MNALVPLRKDLEAAEALGDNATVAVKAMDLGKQYFELEEYHTAKKYFHKASRAAAGSGAAGSPSKQAAVWTRKCVVNIEEEEGSDYSDSDNDEVRASAVTAAASATSNQSAPAGSSTGEEREPFIRVEWFQTLSNVTWTLFVKQMRAGDVRVEPVLMAGDGSVASGIKIHLSNLPLVVAPKGTRSSYTYDLSQLFAPIKVKSIQIQLTGMKVEVLVTKVDAVQWPTVQAPTGGASPSTTTTATEKQNGADARAAYDAKLQYPNSKGRDWSQFKVDEKEVEDMRPEGEQGVHHDLKWLYSMADDEAKRAMMKSFQESKGCTFSSNWERVKDEKVQGGPREGCRDIESWEEA